MPVLICAFLEYRTKAGLLDSRLAVFSKPVRPKYSCGAIVVFEQAAKALSAYDRSPKSAVDRSVGRKQQDVALAHVIPLRMKMLHELRQRTSQ